MGLRVYLGPLTAEFRDPIFVSTTLQLAAELAVDVSLRDERDIEFTNVRIENLNISFLGGGVTEDLRTLIEESVTTILERLIERALNQGLPTLPLPEFGVPESLAEFDLCASGANGALVCPSLGLRGPSLDGREAIWSLGGTFGE